MFRHIALALAGSAALMVTPAQADQVYWSVNVGVPGVVSTFSNAYPVYQAPPRLPPVYFAPPPPPPPPPPPRPVVYGYVPGYAPPMYWVPVRPWERDHWRHGYDRRDWYGPRPWNDRR